MFPKSSEQRPIIDLFAGTRDTPKHQIVLFNYVLRKRALIEGKRLVQEGRLDASEEVFDLNFSDLESAALSALVGPERGPRRADAFPQDTRDPGDGVPSSDPAS